MNEDEKSVLMVGHRRGMSVAASVAMAVASIGAGSGIEMPSIRSPRLARDYQGGGLYNTDREQARRVRQMRRDAVGEADS